jgi:hypothetical protein
VVAANGVGRPGAVGRYRVYAGLAVGGERASRTMKVKRPR